ncbi:MAG: hypothetical protein B7Z53_01330 [Rhodospirillales bacterium 12-71-4]|nr:MAG: hypothetical protein B7Z53_01330 [Rhodospirillales bacterium 12-71-4]
MNAATLSTPRLLRTTSTCSMRKVMLTGARSWEGSKGRLRNRKRFTATGPLEDSTSAWPSGALRTTCSMPRLPPAPARFSTTMGWPSSSLIFAA